MTNHHASEKAQAPRYGGDVYGGWQPTTLTDLLECENDPYITPIGVTPDWVLELRAAAEDCRAGHPSGIASGRAYCAMQRCRGVTSAPGSAGDSAREDG